MTAGAGVAEKSSGSPLGIVSHPIWDVTLTDEMVIAATEESTRSMIRFGLGIGRCETARAIARELRLVMKTGAPDKVCRRALEIFVRNCDTGGILRCMNSRLRSIPTSHPEDSNGLVTSVSTACGDLSNFIWLIWAGMKTSKLDGPLFRGVELRADELDELRSNVGKIIVWPGFSTCASTREIAEKDASAWRGGVSVVFEVRSAYGKRLGDTFVLPPFSCFRVDAVTGSVVHLTGACATRRPLLPKVNLPPGLQPGVIPARLRSNLMGLHDAVHRGDLRAIKRFRRKPEFVNACGPAGLTPLHLAVLERKVEIVRLLGAMGARVDTMNAEGHTALTEAVAYGLNEMLAELVDLGADLDKKDAHGWTALQYAARDGMFSAFSILVGLGADVHALTSQGSTALFIAARFGRDEIVRRLVALGADIEATGPLGWTPLMCAAVEGQVGAVRALIDLGADVNTRHGDGSPLLMTLVAVRHQRTDVIELILLQNVDVDATSLVDGATAMLHAAQNGSSTIIRMLAAKGAKIDPRESDGKTPLWVAARVGHESALRTLARLGADVDAETYFGVTAMGVAADRGHLNIVSALAELGADLSAGRAFAPLHRSAHHGNVAMIRLLISLGADVNGKTSEGSTPIWFATEANQPEAVRVLAEAGADVNVTHNGLTALAYARTHGRAAAVQALLAAGAV